MEWRRFGSLRETRSCASSRPKVVCVCVCVCVCVACVSTACVCAGLAPSLPEDLYHLIKKAVAIRKHLEKQRKDKDAKFRLILVESRVHRLARYYKRKRVLPPNWK